MATDLNIKPPTTVKTVVVNQTASPWLHGLFHLITTLPVVILTTGVPTIIAAKGNYTQAFWLSLLTDVGIAVISALIMYGITYLLSLKNPLIDQCLRIMVTLLQSPDLVANPKMREGLLQLAETIAAELAKTDAAATSATTPPEPGAPAKK